MSIWMNYGSYMDTCVCQVFYSYGLCRFYTILTSNFILFASLVPFLWLCTLCWPHTFLLRCLWYVSWSLCHAISHSALTAMRRNFQYINHSRLSITLNHQNLSTNLTLMYVWCLEVINVQIKFVCVYVCVCVCVGVRCFYIVTNIATLAVCLPAVWTGSIWDVTTSTQSGRSFALEWHASPSRTSWVRWRWTTLSRRWQWLPSLAGNSSHR